MEDPTNFSKCLKGPFYHRWCSLRASTAWNGVNLGQKSSKSFSGLWFNEDRVMKTFKKTWNTFKKKTEKVPSIKENKTLHLKTIYSLRSFQSFLSLLQMYFIYLSTYMSDTSYLNQTIGDKKWQGNKFPGWHKSGSKTISDWNRPILKRQNVMGADGNSCTGGQQSHHTRMEVLGWSCKIIIIINDMERWFEMYIVRNQLFLTIGFNW